MKDPLKVKQGRLDRTRGKLWEKRVREELTKQGWLVTRWDNQVNLETSRLEQSKAKFNPFTKRVMMLGGGMPDFVCIKPTEFRRAQIDYGVPSVSPLFQVFLVESKMNNHLDKLEKQKMQWIEENLKIPCYVAYPEKEKNKLVMKLRRYNE